MKLFLGKDMHPAGRQAILCFVMSAVTFTVSFFSGSILGFSSELWALTYWGPGLYFCLFNFILRYCYKGFIYEVSVRSAFLGAAFATGLYLSTFETGWRVFGLYTMALTFFHFSEFMAVALTNPRTLSIDSFILNHSLQYGLAAVASWIEWALEYYLFPDMKTYFWLSAIGFLMCIGGELLRKSAMFTAKTNFNHTVEKIQVNTAHPRELWRPYHQEHNTYLQQEVVLLWLVAVFYKVQFVKRPDHELVTRGVYALCRHPSYVGWFYWSIGTQITLLNPFCVVLYTLASWLFFRERVQAEELTLLAFFGEQYERYAASVGTGLPFIGGYSDEKPEDEQVRPKRWSH